MSRDALILGGREFQSRFILGSGKYNVELIQAAGGSADHYLGSAPRQFQRGRKYYGLYSKGNYAVAKYLRGSECRGGCAHRKAF